MREAKWRAPNSHGPHRQGSAPPAPRRPQRHPLPAEWKEKPVRGQPRPAAGVRRSFSREQAPERRSPPRIGCLRPPGLPPASCLLGLLTADPGWALASSLQLLPELGLQAVGNLGQNQAARQPHLPWQMLLYVWGVGVSGVLGVWRPENLDPKKNGASMARPAALTLWGLAMPRPASLTTKCPWTQLWLCQAWSPEGRG